MSVRLGREVVDEGKRIAETLCYDYERMHNTEIRVARIFNTYGPRMLNNDGRVVSNFIVQALKKEPLTIYGDGSQTRSFCYVSDLIDGLYKLMNSNFSKPMNLGNPEEITIKQLSYKIKEKINPNLELKLKDLPEDDPRRRKPDISLAKEIINWSPVIDFDQGLENTINYFKNLKINFLNLRFF